MVLPMAVGTQRNTQFQFVDDLLEGTILLEFEDRVLFLRSIKMVRVDTDWITLTTHNTTILSKLSEYLFNVEFGRGVIRQCRSQVCVGGYFRARLSGEGYKNSLQLNHFFSFVKGYWYDLCIIS
jgi:hypothetical protein